MTYDIRTGVSLYSFQEDYYFGRRDLEGCIEAAVKAGATGIETLAEQMMPGFPNLSDEFYAQYAAWMEKYGAVSVAHDLFVDTKKFPDRMMTFEEMVDSVKRDITHTRKLGAKSIRVIVNTPPEVVEAAAPFARDNGVKMGVEIHSPFSFDDPWIKKHLEVADRVGTDVVGCVPDMGIYVKRFPRIITERALRDGADESIVRDCVKNYDEGGDTEAYYEKVKAKGIDPVTENLAFTTTHFIYTDPKKLADHVDYICHIHAKFYEMDENAHEYSIPYNEIIPILKKAGYQGYMNSEYEGNRHIQDIQEVDSFGQVKLHQTMMHSLIDAEN